MLLVLLVLSGSLMLVISFVLMCFAFVFSLAVLVLFGCLSPVALLLLLVLLLLFVSLL